ncbi:unnamed protein product, partial [marine sediment metagenome]
MLTLTAPDQPVVQGESFRLSGELRRADNNALLSGETITAVFNETSLGSDTTMGGTYNIDGVINEVGTYTITVNFAGSTREGLVLGPSQFIRNVGVIMEDLRTLGIIGAASLGLILVKMGLS